MNHQLNKKEKRSLLIVGTVAFLVVIVLILLMLQGKVIYTKNSSIDTVQSLTCESDQIVYPFFDNDKTDKRLLKINAILNNDEIDTVSLIYRLYYDDDIMIDRFATSLHAAINKSFGADGLEADALGATYSTLSDSVQMTLYAQAKNINNITAKYFLLDADGNYKKESVLKAYNSVGLRCTLNDQINNNEGNNEKIFK